MIPPSLYWPLPFVFPGPQADLKNVLPTVIPPEAMTAQEFKNLRKSFKLSQTELAKILGVVPMTIKRAERHGPTRAVESYLKLALAQGRLQIADD